MRNATEQLADIRGGLMVEELADAMAEVVNAVIVAFVRPLQIFSISVAATAVAMIVY